MKKIFLIISLLFLCGFSFNIKYPVSLFGIKTLDKVTNYISKEEWNALKEKNKDLSLFAIRDGNYQKNSLFQKYLMYVSRDTGTVKIVGATSRSIVKMNSKFSNTCKKKRKKLITSLKELNNIKESDFEKEYFIQKNFDINGKRDDFYKEDYSLIYDVDETKHSLNIECIYSVNLNYLSIQKLNYSLTAVDTENIVTDKKIIKEINQKIAEGRIILEKPLSDELIKNDFRGLSY